MALSFPCKFTINVNYKYCWSTVLVNEIVPPGIIAAEVKHTKTEKPLSHSFLMVQVLVPVHMTSGLTSDIMRKEYCLNSAYQNIPYQCRQASPSLTDIKSLPTYAEEINNSEKITCHV